MSGGQRQMQNRKDMNWAKAVAAKPADEETSANGKESQTEAANDDGWQQYRRWISKAPAPRARRNGIDPNLYTWKGYRNWTEQVKRNWPDDG